MLSPCRTYVNDCNFNLQHNNKLNIIAMNSIVFCLLDSLLTAKGRSIAEYAMIENTPTAIRTRDASYLKQYFGCMGRDIFVGSVTRIKAIFLHIIMSDFAMSVCDIRT